MTALWRIPLPASSLFTCVFEIGFSGSKVLASALTLVTGLLLK
jgi:hypothetical protein